MCSTTASIVNLLDKPFTCLLLSVTGLQMNALKNLGLNVVKANVFLDSSGKHNKFAITRV